LLNSVPNPELLLAKDKMTERLAMAAGIELSEAQILAVSDTYTSIAEKITGQKVQVPADPKAEIIEILDRDYGLIEA